MNVMIKDLPKEDLPRERLLYYGAQNLTNEELIAILIRTGTHNISVKDLASRILSLAGNVSNLKYMTVKKISEIKGLGSVKAVTLLAALELGKRVYEDNKVFSKLKLNNSVDVFRYFSKYIINEFQENFMVIYLDNHKQYIKHKILFKGTINQSIAHPREVFKEAYLEGASLIVLMHNHPSGILIPSKADDELTQNIVNVGNMMGIKVLDHLIVGKGDYFSYIEEGKMIYE